VGPVTVYVDELFHWPGPVPQAAKKHGRVWCHLMTDALCLEELHAFAAGIGLRRPWFQNRRGLPHYDLTPGARGRAVLAGAVGVSCVEIIRLCRRAGLTRVVNVGRGEECDVLVDRGTFWGNHWYEIGPGCTRDMAVDGHFRRLLESEEHLSRLGELRGKALGCHCSPLRCHADNLAFLADFLS
jgi:hypothetical protein